MFGACFYDRGAKKPPIVLSDRPGGRLWQVLCCLINRGGGEPLYTGEGIRGFVFNSRDVDHLEPVSEGSLFQVPQACVANLIE